MAVPPGPVLATVTRGTIPDTVSGSSPGAGGLLEIKDTLYIGGEWVAPAGTATIEVVSPATEEVIARTPEASEGDVDRAVEAAALTDLPAQPRGAGRVHRQASQGIQACCRSYDTITAEMGSPASRSLMARC